MRWSEDMRDSLIADGAKARLDLRHDPDAAPVLEAIDKAAEMIRACFGIGLAAGGVKNELLMALAVGVMRLEMQIIEASVRVMEQHLERERSK